MNIDYKLHRQQKKHCKGFRAEVMLGISLSRLTGKLLSYLELTRS